MINWDVYIYVVVLVGMISFVLNVNHLLNSLISLEYMGVGLYVVISVFFMMFESMIFSVFFLVMLVVESVVGLSLLVDMSFNQGSDYMKSAVICLC